MTDSEKNPKEKQPDRGEEREKRETGEGKRKRDTRGRTKGKEQGMKVEAATAHFSRGSLRFSPQPRVPEVDEHGHVGPFVLGCPSGVCTPGDRDVIWPRSSSTKDETSCPVLSSQALDHRRWSMGEMEDREASGGFGWRMRKVAGGGACGFGVSVRVEEPGGVVDVVVGGGGTRAFMS